jgi:hypothetical protein
MNGSGKHSSLLRYSKNYDFIVQDSYLTLALTLLMCLQLVVIYYYEN